MIVLEVEVLFENVDNVQLNIAKSNRDNEYYTYYNTIEKELSNYSKFLKDKIIYCNCDDILKSEFIYYFMVNFNRFNLKKLIATGLSGYKLEVLKMNSDIDRKEAISLLRRAKKGTLSSNDISVTKLKSVQGEIKGDYSSTECLELLKECDIVITNPPFSLFREFLNVLYQYKKKFLIIGSNLASTYVKNIERFMKHKLRLGFNEERAFFKITKSGKQRAFKVCAHWYTNLAKKYPKFINLIKEYNPVDFPKYKDTDIINVNSYKDIPKDYYGTIGVPVSFILYYNPKQFKIVGLSSRCYLKDKNTGNYRRVFSRVFIERVK